MPSKPAAWLETCPGALRWYERAFFRTPCAERGRLPVQPPRRLTPWLINYVDPQDSTAYLRLPRKEGGKQCSHLARGANKHDAKCKENANGGCCAAVIHEGTKTETRKWHTTRAACDPSSALMQHVLGMDSEPERPTSQESREPRNSTGEKRTTILSSNATRVAPKKAKGPGLVAYMLTRRSRARDRNRKKKNLPLLEGRSHRPRIFG